MSEIFEIRQIYILWDPRNNGKCYIGQAINSLKRYKYGHLSSYSLKAKTLKNSWLKSLLAQGLDPVLEILDEVPESEWPFWERYYISLYKSWGFNLMNGTLGGDGIGKGTLSGDKNPSKRPEIRKKLSEANLGVKSFWFGKKFTTEHCENLGISKKGKIPKNFDIIRAIQEKRKRPVLQYDLLGNFIKEYATATEAAKSNDLRQGTLWTRMQKGKPYKQFMFKYKS
jgi:group I intron endonuclease